MPLPKQKFKVFISHATDEDGKLVRWIGEALDRLYIKAFIYEAYQIGGQNRFDVIKSEIRECPYFLAILTQAGIASQWVNQEIGYAVGVNKSIIPVVELDYTGRRIESKGFVELHDPINYDKNNTNQLMANIIYTFYALESLLGSWKDQIYLSCECGNEFVGSLAFEKNWEQWNQKGSQNNFTLTWKCAKCNKDVNLSFPDCHIKHQDILGFPFIFGAL